MDEESLQFCRSWPDNPITGKKFAVVKSRHTLARPSLLARRQSHECQDHFSRETFQVQVSANICKLTFHEVNKKLPMHGIANLLSITCQAVPRPGSAGCSPFRVNWNPIILKNIHDLPLITRNWFLLRGARITIAPLIATHVVVVVIRGVCDPDTPRGLRDGIQR